MKDETFVCDGIGEGRRGKFHSGICDARILGDDAFADGILAKVNQRGKREATLDEVVNAVCTRF